MTVANGQLADETTFNSSFVSREVDTNTVGKLGLNNTDVVSGPAIANTQRFVNEIADADGTNGEGDTARKDYSSQNFISNGDNRKVAIGKLDEALKLLADDVDTLSSDLVDLTNEVEGLDNFVKAGARKMIGFASDGDYVTANGAPSGGEFYYNTTTGKARYYDAIEATWKQIGAEIVGIQESIGTGDGVTLSFGITNAPLSDESILVMLNGRVIDKSEYSIVLPNINFNTAPALGQSVYVWYLSEGTPASPIIASGTPQVFYRTITAGEIAAKQLTLAIAPSDPTKVVFDFIAGVPVAYGTGFQVTGAILSWNGLELDGFIEENDKIRVQYFT